MLAWSSSSCGGPEEAVRIELPVTVGPLASEAVATDLGYGVQLTEARMVVSELQFALSGELHAASLPQRLHRWMIPEAQAHPGHYQGGDVTGELPGRFLLDWSSGERQVLGRATLLVGAYASANLTFARGQADDGLDEDDELLGHTALLRGEATKDGQTLRFLALIDSPQDRQLVGVPFKSSDGPGQDEPYRFEATEGSEESLVLMLQPHDALQGNGLFDGLDFLALDTDSDGQVRIVPDAEEDAVTDAYNLLRRNLQTHDSYALVPQPLP